jgi:hypothetical protein
MTTFLPGVPRFKGVEIIRWKLERDDSLSLAALDAESPEKIVEVGDPSLVG